MFLNPQNLTTKKDFFIVSVQESVALKTSTGPERLIFRNSHESVERNECWVRLRLLSLATKTLHHSVGGDWGGRPRDSQSVRREEKRKKKDLRGINDGTPGVAKKERDPRRIDSESHLQESKLHKQKIQEKQFFRAKIKRPFTKAVYQ